MKTFNLFVLAVLMSLGVAVATSAESIFGEGTPPARATVAWDATSLVLPSPPAVQGLNNRVTLKFSGTGTARHGSRCNKSYDIVSLGRDLRSSEYGVTLNGSTVSIRIRICGPHAVGKTFGISWSGNAKKPSEKSGTTVSGRKRSGPYFGEVRASFAAGPNCPQTHQIRTGSGPNERKRWGSVLCRTEVTITQ